MSWARLESQPSTSIRIDQIHGVAVLDTTDAHVKIYGKCWFNAGLMVVNSGLMRFFNHQIQFGALFSDKAR